MKRVFVDLKDAPGFNPAVRNGIDSVSAGKVVVGTYLTLIDGEFRPVLFSPGYPHCAEHGAMNKVSPEGIWRCLTCNEGCWEVGDAV